MTKRHEYSSKIADPRQLSLPFAKTKTILAYGHRARQGKDTVAKFIAAHYADRYKIEFINFADALRAEVNQAVAGLVALGGCTRQEALQTLCYLWNATYDPNAVADEVYLDGKQRDMLQKIGQGRRDEYPNYWTDKWVAAVDASDADIILITDMRHPNELALVKQLGGHAIKVSRPDFVGISAEAAAHISETALDGATFDHNIVNNSDLPALQATAIQLFDHIISQKESL